MPSTLVAAAIGVGAHCATDAVGPHLALIEAVCGSDRAQPMRTHRTLWDLCIMLYLHMHGSHESLLAGPTVRLRRTLAVGRPGRNGHHRCVTIADATVAEVRLAAGPDGFPPNRGRERAWGAVRSLNFRI